jgi:hypothetical protein
MSTDKDCMARSENGENEITMRAAPLEPGLAERIEIGDITSETEPQIRAKVLYRSPNLSRESQMGKLPPNLPCPGQSLTPLLAWDQILVEEFEWHKQDANKIWAFGPETGSANILVDCVEGAKGKRLDSARDSILSCFQWCTKAGAPDHADTYLDIYHDCIPIEASLWKC